MIMFLVHSDAVIRINIAEAKVQLSAYVDQAQQGRKIIICRGNLPVAEQRPIVQAKPVRRLVGIDRGRKIPDSFFEPLPRALINAFTGKAGNE